MPLRRDAAELRRRNPSASTPSSTVGTLLVGEIGSSIESPRDLVGETGFVNDRSRPDCSLSLLAPDYRSDSNQIRRRFSVSLHKRLHLPQPGGAGDCLLPP